ncbi:hypothetical protein, partial [Pseudomonas sp. 2995-3]|uniref:hypothetical protein n=1 Tax=Pseudomonas sp. 2995-3 TaxID=1712680 RepID=UPI001C46EBE8
MKGTEILKPFKGEEKMLKSKSFFLSIALMLVLSIALVACGGDEDSGSDADDVENDTEQDDSVDTEEEVESVESDTDTETASDVPEKPEVLTMWVNDE